MAFLLISLLAVFAAITGLILWVDHWVESHWEAFDERGNEEKQP